MSNIKVIAEREDLVAVANAIRNKTGETTGITLSDMPTAIGDITAEPTLQSKTVSPTTSSQTVKPDSGYDGLSQVTVNAMSTATQATPSISVNSNGLITASATQTAGYVTAGTKTATKQLTTQAAKTVTPSASSQTAVESGRYTTGAVMVAGDSNLVAGNIKSGVSIFGVNGSYEGSGSSSGGGFPNGTEWTKSNVSGVGRYVTYLNGNWYATVDTNTYHSLDGKTWTNINIGANRVGYIVYGNGIYAGTTISSSSNSGVVYSTDGITWTYGGSYGYGTMSFVNGLFILGNGYKAGIRYSTDGITWIQSNITSGKHYSATYFKGLFIIPGESGIRYSTDGITWTKSTTSLPTMSYIEINNDVAVAMSREASNANGVWYSLDGITWIQSNITSGKYSSAKYANGLWVVCGVSGLWYSLDGKIWTQTNIVNQNVNCVYNSNGVWVATGNQGLLYSFDGKNWVVDNSVLASTDAVASRTPHISNNNGIWVAACDDGLYYSVTWEPL